jgi:hypothetical protein
VFSKFFKKKSLPKINGTKNVQDRSKSKFQKGYEIILCNMEDSPVYALTEQLTIGSEIGNIVIADPSISPRHVTFNLQDAVISLIDHGSVSGTFINGKKVDPGKQVIVEETDIVMAGDLEVRFKVTSNPSSAEEVPKVPPQQPEKVPITSVDVTKDRLKSGEKMKEEANKKSSKNKKSSLSISSPTSSANAIVRVLAVSADLLLAYSLFVIFYPFDEVREYLDYVPASIAELLGIEWGPLWDSIKDENQNFFQLFSDMGELIPREINLLPILIIFGMIRLISTLFYGVSLSEFFLGIRPYGNGIWARVGGVLRVIIGCGTWPFVVFDLPSIISRRTLKDFLTFTNITVPSKLISMIGILLYLPVVLSLALLSPLIQGIEIPFEIPVDDVLQVRARVNTSPGAEEISAEDVSREIGIQLSFRPAELSLFPNFRFSGKNEKTNLKMGFTVYQKDIQKRVEFDLMKRFDLKSLLALGIKGNFFLYEKYPQIYNYVYDASGTNPAFRKKLDAKDHQQFATEVIQFTKMALSLSPESVLDYIQTETPLLKGILDYRASFLSLIEYKNFDKIDVLKIGNTFFLKIKYSHQKPFDLIIPLLMSEGRIFRVGYEAKETAKEVSSKLYKFSFDKSNWLPGREISPNESFSMLKLVDYFSSSNFKEDLLRPEKAQAFYAFIYETSGTILKSQEVNELELWKGELKDLLFILKKLHGPKLSEGEENPKEKLLQNVNDMLDALENSNYDYFGITINESV